MRFIGYGRAQVRGSKIDWEVPVPVDDEIRKALHPQDPAGLRAGRLQRPFHVRADTAGQRNRQAPARLAHPSTTTHRAGALVFAFADESWFLIEAQGERR